MKNFIYFCLVLTMVLGFSFIATADEENALEASLENEEIMNTQAELDKLREDKAVEKEEYMTDSGEIRNVLPGDEIMTDSGQIRDVSKDGDYMTDSGEIEQVTKD
ncbi:hypothetical protein ACFL5Y_01675 [Candidatus Omnitrophota bacterium]